jgi:hypothetical protein
MLALLITATISAQAERNSGNVYFAAPDDRMVAGNAPVRVVLIIDRSYSMCANPSDSVNGCCTAGDGSGNCMMNDPEDRRIEAAHWFVDSLAANSPESQVGVVAYDQRTTANNPLILNSADNITRIHSLIDAASCESHHIITLSTTIPAPATIAPGRLGKTTSVKATYLGLGLEAGLRAIDNNFETIPADMSRHIIQLTDGAWDDSLLGPDTVIDRYKAQFPGRKAPTIHGIFLSNVDLHTAHNYTAEGCSNIDPVIFNKLEYVSKELTGGLFFSGSTPATVLSNFKIVLATILTATVTTVERSSSQLKKAPHYGLSKKAGSSFNLLGRKVGSVRTGNWAVNKLPDGIYFIGNDPNRIVKTNIIQNK